MSELMDWKSLFAENRKAIEHELKSTNKNKE